MILGSVEELELLASLSISGYKVLLPGGNAKEGVSSDELQCHLQVCARGADEMLLLWKLN